MPYSVLVISVAVVLLVHFAIVAGLGTHKTCPECHNRWAKPFTPSPPVAQLPPGVTLYQCQKCVATLVSENDGPLRSANPEERRLFKSP